MTLKMTINIQVNDLDDLKSEIAEEYDCAIEDIESEAVLEYFESKIAPAKSKSSTFSVVGGDTDGWFVQHIDRISQLYA